MYCSKCGTKNEENVKFCMNCGEELTNSSVIEETKQKENGNMIDNQVVETTVKPKEGVIVDVNKAINQNNEFINQNIPTSGNQEKFSDKLKKIDKKFYFIGGIIIGIIILLILIISISKNFGGKKVKNINDIKDSSSFFIRSDDGKYALFNEDGKQLTGFDFTKANNTFVNKTTVVENEKNEKGIINDNGKMVVPFGKYESIYTQNGMYKVTDKEYNSYLLDSKGKELDKLNDKDLMSYMGESGYSILQTKEEYKVFNYQGKVLVKFKRLENEDDKPKVNSEDQYVSVFYNNKNYILDIINEKKVMEFDSDKHFCIKTVNENNDSQLILNSCVGWAESQESVDYRFVNNGKLLYEKSKVECNNLYFEDDLVICNASDGKYILDNKGDKSENLSDHSYIDGKTYSKQTDGAFNGVDFYVEGQLKKHIDCLKLSDTKHSKNGIYILGTYYSTRCNTTSGTYQLFTKDGSLLTDKKYRSITNFDTNGIAIVTEDKENYYLINSKGEQVGNTYSRIRTATKEYYIATISNDEVVLLDVKGKELIKGEDIKVNKMDDKSYAIVENGNEYIVYDVSNNKIITSLTSKPVLSDKYFTTISDGKKQYYSYTTGKMFYESRS